MRASVLALTLSLSAGAMPAAQPSAEEHRLKAAFVSQFVQFAQWPAQAFQQRDGLTLCVPAAHPLGPELADLVGGTRAADRPVVVRPLGASDPVTHCHALVLAGPRDGRAAARLAQARAQPILTIGDTDGFLDAGGIIELRVIDRRIRFAISLDNAREAGLQLSAQLLRLAVETRGGPA